MSSNSPPHNAMAARPQQGSTLLAVTGFMTLALMAIMLTVTTAHTRHHTVSTEADRVAALYLAEAGARVAVAKLHDGGNGNLDGHVADFVTALPAGGVIPVGVVDLFTEVVGAGNGSDDQNADGFLDFAPGLTTEEQIKTFSALPSGTLRTRFQNSGQLDRLVRCYATIKGHVRIVDILMVEQPKGDPRWALYGGHHLHIEEEMRLDSYDSSQGPYNPTYKQVVINGVPQWNDEEDDDPPDDPIMKTYDSANLYVSSNDKLEGKDGMTLFGDGFIGLTGTLTDMTQAKGFYGNVSILAADRDPPLPLYTVPDTNDNAIDSGFSAFYDGNNLKIDSGGPVTLGAPGASRTFVVDNNAEIKDGSEVLIEGHVTFYVDHDFKLDGGDTQLTLAAGARLTIYVQNHVTLKNNSVLNPSQVANNVHIYIKPENPISSPDSAGNITIDSSNDFAGIIYAPSSEVEIKGGGDFYGMIISRKTKFPGGAGDFHFDEASKVQFLDPNAELKVLYVVNPEKKKFKVKKFLKKKAQNDDDDD